MLPKKHRLVKSVDFRRVNKEGESWAERAIVLRKVPNGLPYSRFGFSVSHHIGKAVTRNRAKRLMREVVRLHCDLISPGWDVVFIARKGIAGLDYWAVERAITQLLRSAGLFRSQTGAAGGQVE